MRWAARLLLALMAGWATNAFAAPCPCSDVFVGDATPFIAEGITRDIATDGFLIASVASRRIVAIRNGRQQDFAHLPADYSPLGIAVVGRTLWVTAAVVPQGSGHEGPSALIAFDSRGKLTTIYPVADDGRHVLNDLTFAPDGTIYASDARDGSLYALAPGAKALTRLGKRGLLKSPQGMAVSADGKFLLVADYSLGLVKLDLATVAFTPLQIPESVNVRGIDGLARLPDGTFLASQNGTRAPHILRLALSADWSKLLSADVIAQDDPAVADPSLVMADQSGAYVVGVSQWASFGKDQQTPTSPLQPWRIVKLKLNAGP
jgi:sugar lactone lactonase YvrE